MQKVAIFDIDNTLAVGHYRGADWANPDDWCWEKFEAAMADADVIEAVSLLVDHHRSAGHKVIMLSARPPFLQDMTINWLVSNNIEYDLLFVMSEIDFQLAESMRTEEGVQVAHSKFKETVVEWLTTVPDTDIVAAYDDSIHNVEVFKKFNIPTFHVHA